MINYLLASSDKNALSSYGNMLANLVTEIKQHKSNEIIKKLHFILILTFPYMKQLSCHSDDFIFFEILYIKFSRFIAWHFFNSFNLTCFYYYSIILSFSTILCSSVCNFSKWSIHYTPKWFDWTNNAQIILHISIENVLNCIMYFYIQSK